mgnify:CR=1 FL=1
MVLEERKILPQDLLWTSYLKELPAWGEKPLKEGKETSLNTRYDDFKEWLGTNVMSQKQKGYAVAVVTLPLGDLNSSQPVPYPHLRAHETRKDLVCRLLLEKKKQKNQFAYGRISAYTL